MDRRRFLLTSLAGALATPLAAAAQPAPRPTRIALVCGARCEGGGYDAFRQELRALGWVEGRNLVVDVRGAEGQGPRPHDPPVAAGAGGSGHRVVGEI
jgi:putative ABC transport system substrate-binding protein